MQEDAIRRLGLLTRLESGQGAENFACALFAAWWGAEFLSSSLWQKQFDKIVAMAEQAELSELLQEAFFAQAFA